MKNRKFTGKKILVVILAAILFGMCIGSPTFSWFTRPRMEYDDGKAMNFNVPNSVFYRPGVSLQQSEAPKAYSGSGVSMQTFVSTNDGVSFSNTAAAPATSGSLGTTSPSNRKYYKTTITNKSGVEQNVSLYIKNFKPSGQVCVGTNVPVKSFKNYGLSEPNIAPPTRTMSDGDTKRVYFEPVGKVPNESKYASHKTTWADKTYYVFSSTDGSSFTPTPMTVTPNYSGIFWADIPWNHNQCYFACATNPQNYQRTQTFTNLYGDGLTMTQSLLFYTNGTYTDGYNNAWAGKQYCEGASFAHYYKDITITAADGESVSVALTRGTDYQSKSGTTVTYAIDDTEVAGDTGSFTVSPAGEITPNTSLTTTTKTKLKYTVTSYYGDTKVISVKVTVKSNSSTETIPAAPIVTNLLLAASGDNATQDVYWFIQNGDEMYGKANGNGSYTLDGIYLGV